MKTCQFCGMPIIDSDDWCIWCGEKDIDDLSDEEGSDDSGTEE